MRRTTFDNFNVFLPRKLSEALGEYSDDYKSLFEYAKEGIIVSNPDGRIIAANGAAVAILGYDNPEELVGVLGPDLYVDLKQRKKVQAALVKKGYVQDMELTLKRKDGTTVQVLGGSTLIRDQKGKPLRVETMWMDISERKRAEDALRQSEEQYRLLAENMADVITITDLNGENPVYTSPSVTNLLGYSVEEARKMSLFDTLTPDSLKVAQKIMDRELSTEKIAKVLNDRLWSRVTTLELYRKDGSSVWTEVRVSFLRDNAGPKGLLIVIRDITERLKITNLLVESEEKYRSLVERVPNTLWTAEASGKILFISPNAEKVMGFAPDRLYSDDGFSLWMSRVHPDDVNKLRASLRNLFNKNKSFEIEYRFRKKNRKWIWLNTRPGVPYLKNGLIYVDGITSDITERKQFEDALLKSETEYKMLVENAQEGIVVICSDCIRYANRRASEISGYSIEELKSRPFVDLFKSRDSLTVLERHKQILKGDMPLGFFTLEFTDKNGNNKWINGSEILINWEGKPATLNFLSDITLRKKMEQQVKEYSEGLERKVEERTRELRDAQEKLIRTEKLAAIGQLAGSVGHELRNPLATIKTSVYFIKTKLGESIDEKVHRHLDILDQQVNACNKIITDILDFSRQGNTVFVKTDINQLVKQQTLAIQFPQNIEVLFFLDENLPKTMADPGQLERVLSNLITNAVQAMPDGGKLTLRTGYESGIIKLEVADTGVGIIPENLKKIFDPLFTTKAKGVGLGLALSRALVERHGGTIEIKSQVGTGTTFTIKLPAIAI